MQICRCHTNINQFATLKFLKWNGKVNFKMWNSHQARESELIQNVRLILVETRQRQGPSIQQHYWLRTFIKNREVCPLEGLMLDLSSVNGFMICLCISSVLIVMNFGKSILRSEVRRVPSIPLSQLLIRASRWFDRCPPQRELSSKNGLTLETWIFIFSDNCTMSGHIRQGLMRNRLRLRAASLTQSEVRWREVWSRHWDKDERRIKMKILNTRLWSQHTGGKWQNDVMMIHHKVRIANQSHPLPVAEPQLFNIHSY